LMARTKKTNALRRRVGPHRPDRQPTHPATSRRPNPGKPVHRDCRQSICHKYGISQSKKARKQEHSRLRSSGLSCKRLERTKIALSAGSLRGAVFGPDSLAAAAEDLERPRISKATSRLLFGAEHGRASRTGIWMLLHFAGALFASPRSMGTVRARIVSDGNLRYEPTLKGDDR